MDLKKTEVETLPPPVQPLSPEGPSWPCTLPPIYNTHTEGMRVVMHINQHFEA